MLSIPPQGGTNKVAGCKGAACHPPQGGTPLGLILIRPNLNLNSLLKKLIKLNHFRSFLCVINKLNKYFYYLYYLLFFIFVIYFDVFLLIKFELYFSLFLYPFNLESGLVYSLPFDPFLFYFG